MNDELRNVLSTQNVTSHVTMFCTGTIVSIAANDVQMGGKELAEFDPDICMKAIAGIQNTTQLTASRGCKPLRMMRRTGHNMLVMQATKEESWSLGSRRHQESHE